MKSPDRQAVVDALAVHERLLEVGIGRRPEVAAQLASRNRDVIAIDVDAASVAPAELPEAIPFREADVLDLADRAERAPTDLDDRLRVDAVYALNLPAELQRPTLRFADAIDAVFLFTTLGFEQPAVPVERRAVDDETLFVARPRDGSSRRP